MKGLFQRALSVLLAIALLIPTFSVEAEAALEVAATTLRLESAEGRVSLANKSGKAVSIINGMKLFNGYKLETGAASYAYMSLDSASLVKLDADSSAEVSENGSQLEVLLHSGSILVDVTEPLEDKTLNIRTSTMVTGIRGTSLVVRAVDKFTTQVYFLDGHGTVTVADPLTGKSESIDLAAGQNAVVQADAGRNLMTSDTEIAISGLTEDDVDGFVAVEVLRNAALADRIREATSLDVDAIAMDSYNRLGRDQAAAEVLRERAKEQSEQLASNISVEPYFTDEPEPLPAPEPATPARPLGTTTTPPRQIPSTDQVREQMQETAPLPPVMNVTPPSAPIYVPPVEDSGDYGDSGSSGGSGGGYPSGPGQTPTPSSVMIIERDFGDDVGGDTYDYNREIAARFALIDSITLKSDNDSTLRLPSAIEIPAGKTLTIESGTVGIEQSAKQSTSYAIVNLGTFTMNGGAVDNAASVAVLNRGKMHLADGTIAANVRGIYSDTAGAALTITGGSISAGTGVYSGENTSVTMSGGVIEAVYEGIHASDGTAVNITGGTIDLLNSTAAVARYGVFAASGSNVTISGGTILAAAQGVFAASDSAVAISDGAAIHSGTSYAISALGDAEVEISGAPVITSDGLGIIDDILSLSHTDLDISLSQEAGDTTAWKLVYSNAPSSSVMIIERDFGNEQGGGTYAHTGQITMRLALVDSVTLRSDDGSTLLLNSAIEIPSGKTLKLESGTVRNSSTAENDRAINVSGGTFMMTGGVIDAGYYGVYTASGSTVGITGGRIAAGQSGVYTYDDSTIRISDCVIDAGLDGAFISNGIVKITDCVINAVRYGAYTGHSDLEITGGSIEAGSHGVLAADSTVEITDCAIDAGAHGIYAYNGSAAKITDSAIDAGAYGVIASGSDAEIAGCAIDSGDCSVYAYGGSATITSDSSSIHSNGSDKYALRTSEGGTIEISNAPTITSNGLGIATLDGSSPDLSGLSHTDPDIVLSQGAGDSTTWKLVYSSAPPVPPAPPSSVMIIEQDFGDDQGGGIYNHSGEIATALALHDSVTLRSDNGSTLELSSPIVVAQGKTLTLESGTVRNGGTDTDDCAVYANGGGTFMMTGGAVEAGYNGVYAYGGGSAAITGGSVRAGYIGVCAQDGSVATISNATIVAAVGVIADDNSRATITDCVIDGVHEGAGALGNSSITVAGGAIVAPYGLGAESGSSIDVSGAAIASGDVGVLAYDGGTVQISDCSIVSGGDGISITDGGSAELSGVEIEADSRGVYVYNGTAQISGGVIEALGDGVLAENVSTVAILGGAAVRSGGGVYLHRSTAAISGDSTSIHSRGSDVYALFTIGGSTIEISNAPAITSDSLGAANDLSSISHTDPNVVLSQEVGDTTAWKLVYSSAPSPQMPDVMIIERDFGSDQGGGTYNHSGQIATAFASYDSVTLRSDNGSALELSVAIEIPAGKTLTLESGTIRNSSTAEFDSVIYVSGGTFLLTGGTVDAGYYGIYTIVGSTVEMSGGRINASKSGIYTYSGSTIKITGGRIDAGLDGLFISNSVVEITDCVIDAARYGVYAGGSAVEINGGRIDAGEDAVMMSSSTAEITGCIIDAVNRGVYAYNGSVVEITGCTIEADRNGVYLSSVSTVKIIGDGTSIHVRGSNVYALQIALGSIVQISNAPTITSDGYGIANDFSGVSHTDPNVVLSQEVGGTTAWKLVYTSAPASQSVVMIIERDFGDDQGGGTYKQSGQIAAVFGSYDSITIRSDNGSTLLLNSAIEIPAGKTLTLESGTISISQSVSYAIVNNLGTFKVNGGAITTVGSVAVRNRGEVYVTDGTITSADYAVHSDIDGATVVISGGRIEAPSGVRMDENTELTISGGMIDAEFVGVYSAGATVNVTGGTIDALSSTATVARQGILAISGSSVTISGGVIEAEMEGISATSGSFVEISGGAAIYSASGHTINVSGAPPVEISGAPALTSDGYGIIGDIFNIFHTDPNIVLSQEVGDTTAWKLVYSGKPAPPQSEVMIIERDFGPDQGGGIYKYSGEIATVFALHDRITLRSDNGSTLESSTEIEIPAGKTLTLESGTVRNSSTVLNERTINANGGSFVMTGGLVEGVSHVVYAYLGNVEISGGAIMATTYGVYLNESTGDISNCDIDVDGIGIYLAYRSTATISDCDISSAFGSGVQLHDNSHAQINDCIISAEHGVYLYHVSSAQITDCSIDAFWGVYAYDKSSAAITGGSIDAGGYGFYAYDSTGEISGSNTSIHSRASDKYALLTAAGSIIRISDNPLITSDGLGIATVDGIALDFSGVSHTDPGGVTITQMQNGSTWSIGYISSYNLDIMGPALQEEPALMPENPLEYRKDEDEDEESPAGGGDEPAVDDDSEAEIEADSDEPAASEHEAEEDEA